MDLTDRVARVWKTLRPVTKNLIARELQSQPVSRETPRLFYDAHADLELSSLLAALDEESASTEVRADATKFGEISQLANTCVRMLEAQSASAEVFIQLASRAIRDNDYARLDRLSDRLTERYSAGEIAEIIRQTELPPIRAIAYETLAMLPVSTIAPLLDDSLYADIAAAALEQKAWEFEDEDARLCLEQFDAEMDAREPSGE